MRDTCRAPAAAESQSMNLFSALSATLTVHPRPAPPHPSPRVPPPKINVKSPVRSIATQQVRTLPRLKRRQHGIRYVNRVSPAARYRSPAAELCPAVWHDTKKPHGNGNFLEYNVAYVGSCYEANCTVWTEGRVMILKKKRHI